ncbi:MAG: bifunctional [glutamine synthetase] adenylyltransferase/[glutamine synthetase]-adenylyl-L-tyrosine phosphorylase, partial [Actinobacteria bacterium]|nr:bifunctional [glutamine synthetase] adenylyltransferase/[glutamine synthetase]-adenylyl-L-tyrosine phosphorylase [Actinomycetota bacterium]
GLLRVAARDLLGLANTTAAAGELADLAAGTLRAALAHVTGLLEPQARLAIVAMGKLGGRELNYVSDVDVMFVHDGDLGDATRTVERLLRLVGAVTPQGRAYEVDANLRPEGRDGPLVRNLASYEAYYRRWARTWEFHALLKARPVAGDAELGRRFTELVAPFVWPDRLEASAVEDIQRMKARVEGSRDVVRAAGRQVKLGPGGLRDVEFAVQLLQLVHGRHDQSLRSPNTLEGLWALSEGGYVGEDDAALIHDAYRFLRTLEHRLQLVRLRRTHLLPADEAQRTRLARSMGYRDRPGAAAPAQLDDALRRVRGDVRRVHEKLFYRPLLSRFAELGAEDRSPVAGGDGDGRLGERSAWERLSALGFADPQAALRHVTALAGGVTRPARLFRTALPAMLPVIAASPDPDGGLLALRSLSERLGDAPLFVGALRDNPPVGELLARVLGHSRLVGEWLERQPEVFGVLADMAGLSQAREAGDYHRLAEGLLRRGDDRETAADALRRLKRREVARTAVRDIGGQVDPAGVGRELTGLAEACLEAGVALATHGTVRLAVVGMGKLGGRELGYSSDLDVMLVFAPAGRREEAGHAAERLLGLLSAVTPEGRVFRVDPNLRPEGKDGPLARSLDSYLAYYRRWGEPWELQALTQARPVAGDAELGAAFVEAVTPLLYPPEAPPERLQAVRRMKARVERERSHRARPRAPGHAGVRAGDRVDVKLGPGGLSDVEWTVQLLQLQHGGREPAVRAPGTRVALEALRAAEAVDERDARWLGEAVDRLSAVRNALYLGGYRDSDHVPPGARDQERLARLLGYPPGGAQALLDGLGRTMRRVRRVHERLFFEV